MAIATEDDKQVNLWPYVVQFGVVYLFANVGAQVVFKKLDWEPSMGLNVIVILIVLYFSGTLAVRKFVLDHHRPFKRREQLRFALLGALSVVVVNYVVVAVVTLFEGGFADKWSGMDVSSATPLELALVVAILSLLVFLVSFALLYFPAGMLSRKYSKMPAEKGKI